MKKHANFSLENKDYVNTYNKLNEVGKGFCLAKWTQVTIHLQMGQTHSCHHPNTHKIPIKELSRNPTALHNTKYKKKLRKEMLNGFRPYECKYCWNIEDTSDRFSDRIFKSSEPWSAPHYDDILEGGYRKNFNPRYVEVSFSNNCNFKCSYCGPSFSSAWMSEAKIFGAYPTDDNFNSLEQLKIDEKIPLKGQEYNVYVKAFWDWWPELYRDLHTFRITGGEPLMSKDTWKILDYIIEQKNPNRKLKIAINSNLGVSDSLIDKLINKLKIIEDNNLVSEIIIFTSVDTAGRHAEYIRNGLVYDKFIENIHKVLSNTNRVGVTIMSTYNALSLLNYNKLIDDVYEIKRLYTSHDRYLPSSIFLDTSYLRHPRHQIVRVLPKEWSKYILDSTKYMDYLATKDFSADYIGYSDIEIQKLKRTYDWMVSPIEEEDLRKIQRNFGKFFKAHDSRRGTDFKKTFPELADFYNYTQKIK